MNDQIKISQRYGVNPSLAMCAWCGKDKGVALLGLLPNDAEAPRRIMCDINPCDTCKEQMQQGITIVSVTPHAPKNGMPPLTDKPQTLYMTGQWCVVKDDFIKNSTLPKDEKDKIFEQKAMMVDAHVFEDIMRNLEAVT